MARDPTAAITACDRALAAMAASDVAGARAAVAAARRALDHWGFPWVRTAEQAERAMRRPLVEDPVSAAATWLQLADHLLRGDVLAGEEPYHVREYLAQDDPYDPPASDAVKEWCRTHRIIYLDATRPCVATARHAMARIR